MQDFSSLLERGVETIIDKDHLRNALSSGKKLRVKLGIDPTGTNIHIGRAVLLWKLRAFQDAGHQIVLIIGDFTAQIGDASDKLAKRPFLTEEQVQGNLKNYLGQIGKILDLDRVEVRYNSEWLSKLTFREIAQLAEVFSVAQMIERRNFRERWDKHEEISLREFLYPLMQGYDSVAVSSDLEIGGSDQLFNLTAGRVIQKYYNKEQQDVLTMQMLYGTDGRKMSTSWGNVINITDSAVDQFGKVMSMHDAQIFNYFLLATDVPEDEIANYQKEIADGRNPKEVKEILASAIVRRYHGADVAMQAREHFSSLFSKKEIPDDIPTLSATSPLSVLDLVVLSKVVTSRSEARRLIEQGAVSIRLSGGTLPESVCSDAQKPLSFETGDILKVGKRHFFRLKL